MPTTERNIVPTNFTPELVDTARQASHAEVPTATARARASLRRSRRTVESVPTTMMSADGSVTKIHTGPYDSAVLLPNSPHSIEVRSWPTSTTARKSENQWNERNDHCDDCEQIMKFQYCKLLLRVWIINQEWWITVIQGYMESKQSTMSCKRLLLQCMNRSSIYYSRSKS